MLCETCGTSHIFYQIKVPGNIKRLTLNKVRGPRFGRNKPAIPPPDGRDPVFFWVLGFFLKRGADFYLKNQNENNEII